LTGADGEPGYIDIESLRAAAAFLPDLLRYRPTMVKGPDPQSPAAADASFGGRPGRRCGGTRPGRRPASAKARRSRNSIWALVLRS